MQLANKVLLWDSIKQDALARYEIEPGSKSIVYNSATKTIVVLEPSQEVLVPLTSEDFDYDRVLIDMLEKASEQVTVKPSCSSINDSAFLKEVAAYFSDNKLYCRQLVVHPDNSKEIRGIVVHETDLCPINKAYFLPESHFLGAFVTKELPNQPKQIGISVMHPLFVLAVDIKSE